MAVPARAYAPAGHVAAAAATATTATAGTKRTATSPSPRAAATTSLRRWSTRPVRPSDARKPANDPSSSPTTTRPTATATTLTATAPRSAAPRRGPVAASAGPRAQRSSGGARPHARCDVPVREHGRPEVGLGPEERDELLAGQVVEQPGRDDQGARPVVDGGPGSERVAVHEPAVEPLHDGQPCRLVDEGVVEVDPHELDTRPQGLLVGQRAHEEAEAAADVDHAHRPGCLLAQPLHLGAQQSR